MLFLYLFYRHTFILNGKPMKNNQSAVQALISFFGNQEKTAKALQVKQGSVSGWLTGRHGVSPIVALRAESITRGTVKSADLCPALADKPDVA